MRKRHSQNAPSTRVFPSARDLGIRVKQTISGVSTTSYQRRFIDTTSSVTHGNNVPDWRKKIARGLSATTTLVGNKKQVKGGYGTHTYASITQPSITNGAGSGGINDIHVIFPAVSTVISVDADNKARSRLLASVISAKNTWRGGNFLAELGETVEFIRHPLKAFYQRTWSFAGTVRDLGKIWKQNPHIFSKEIANAYLAYIFGVAPLVNDISDVTAAVNDQLGFHRFDRKPVHGTGVIADIQSGTSAYTAPVGFPDPGLLNHSKVKLTSNVRYKGSIKATSTAIGQQFDTVGLTVYDILPAVWEATWYSFVIDYFVNVSEMIDALRYADVSVIYLNRTYRNSGVQEIQALNAHKQAGGYNVTVDVDKVWSLQVHVDRRSASLPYPNWVFKVPGIGSMKWLNIDALLLQCGVLRGKK